MRLQFFKFYKPITAIVICSLVTSISYAQPPDDNPTYYDNAFGLSGAALKAELNTIITTGHVTYPYAAGGIDVWDILKEADRDPNNPNNVIGVYSQFSMDGPLEYDGGDGWSKEHVWPQSRGGFGTAAGAGTDTHSLRAEDVSVNSTRNNRNFDYALNQVIDGSGPYQGPTGSYTGAPGPFTFEPRDEMKGDVARSLLYMATRYEGFNGEVDLELTDLSQAQGDTNPLHAFESTLLEWHATDTVDAAERARHEIIYDYQDNRNPYIDFPEFVWEIYTHPVGNTSPLFTSVPVLNANVDANYEYLITASDANGDALTITLDDGFGWLNLMNTGNGMATLSGIPPMIGNYDASLTVDDGFITSTRLFRITVGPAIYAPTFTSDPVTSVFANSSYSYEITAEDPQGDDMAFISLLGLPGWLLVPGLTDNMDGTATLQGNPGPGDIGDHNIEIQVSDIPDGNTATQIFTITVLPEPIPDLMISEYDEGSGLNKGIEIANYTGVAVDLANYTVQKQTNGTNNPWADLPLNGILDHGDVYVIVHPSASLDMQALADVTDGTVANFNGDDPVGIFNNADLVNPVDVFGVFDSGGGNIEGFSTEHTLVRLPGQLFPNDTYNVSEWEESAQNTDFLGYHYFEGTAPCAAATALQINNITMTEADFSWNAVAESYNVRYREISASIWTYADSDVTSFSLTGLTEDTDYEYQVQTVCSLAAGGGSSQFTASANFTTDPIPCDITIGLEVNEVESNSVEFSWSDTPGALSYNIRYRPIAGIVFWNTDLAGIMNNSTNVFGLSPSTDYEVQIQTVCDGNTSDFSPSVNFTTKCPIPTGLGTSGIAQNGAGLTWDAVPGALGYHVRWKEVSAIPWNTSVLGPVTDLILATLDPFTDYHFQVRTVCADGRMTQYSDLYEFTTLPEPCLVPTGLMVSNITGNSADFDWDAVPGATSYTVRWKKKFSIGAGSWSSWNVVNNTLSGWKLSPANRYLVQVKSFCPGSESIYSPIVEFNTPFVIARMADESGTSEEVLEKELLMLSPNPSSGEVSVRLFLQGSKGDEVVYARVYDVNGKLIQAREKQMVNKIYTDNLNLTDSKEGIYILKLYTKSGIIQTQRIRIQR